MNIFFVTQIIKRKGVEAQNDGPTLELNTKRDRTEEPV